MNLQIRVMSNPEDLLSLKSSWKNLLKGSDYPVFSTWEWLSTWWKHCGNNNKLLVLLAEENGAIAGIAPLMYSNDKIFGLRRGKIRFIGAPDSDYSDFIIAEKREDCLKLFFEYLNTLPEKWNFVDLEDIPQNAKCLPYLTNISKDLKPINSCPYLLLPESYEEFLTMLSPKKRKYIKNGMKKLEENFEVEFVDYSQPEHFSQGMEEFFQLHQKKWKSLGCSGVFSDPKMCNFHMDIAKIFSKDGWLSLNVLKLSGNPVAAEYGFKYNSKYYAYLAGYDPAYSKYSVGNMLFVHIIRNLIQEKLTQYDFLRGSEQYKSYWTATSKSNYQALINSKDTFAGVQYWVYNSLSNINKLIHLPN
ncbi:MAG: GNAT family N-acetyltransferase [Candidatus Bathyarchaeia archaeon]